MVSDEQGRVFGIIVRTIGLIVGLYGLYCLWYMLMRSFGMSTRANLPPTSAFMFGVFYLVLGVVILRKADWVVRFAYDQDSN
jgi:hypothetical protein